MFRKRRRRELEGRTNRERERGVEPEGAVEVEQTTTWVELHSSPAGQRRCTQTAVMECLKDCFKTLMKNAGKEAETEVISLKMPPDCAAASAEGRKSLTEDYFLSKLPMEGREVPFVLPSFKASYIQPKDPRCPELQGSAYCTYAERKAELFGLQEGPMMAYVSPGSTCRDTLRKPTPQNPGWHVLAGSQQLSSSMFDMTSPPQRHIEHFDFTTSTLNSSSSTMGFMESSLDSVTLSGDVQELGRVCVCLSYQESVEQVWITLVQCSDLTLPTCAEEQQKFGFKGIITIPKPIQFKSSVKECSQNVSFMETFVFALHLQQLRCSALVLRLQTFVPKKQTVAECVVSLRQLGPQQAEHWLDLSPPSKSSTFHSELHLSTCFQPVSGRLTLQILAAQNLPVSSSPLTQVFFVKVELQQEGRTLMKKQTSMLKAAGGHCQWAETFHFLLADMDSLSIKLCSCSSVKRKRCLGQLQLGFHSSAPQAVEQWKDTMAHPEKVVATWHCLSPF